MMVNRFCQFVAQEDLFTTTDRLLVAVSGGLDSTALVHLLSQAGFSFGVGHCNYQLREDESDEDARFVRQLSEQLGVAYHETRFATQQLRQPGESVQMCARRLRYQWLKTIRKKEQYDYLLTAHHLYDSFETMLLNFSRGTGIAGLQGIPVKVNRLRRPLLFCGRPQLAAWVAQQKIAYREDRSNAEEKYRRNQIRHQVLPVLEAMNPAFAETLYANFTHLRSAHHIYRQTIDNHLERLIQQIGDRWMLAKDALLSTPESTTILFEALRPYGFDAEQLNQLLSGKTGTILESATHQILINDDTWVWQAKTKPTKQEVDITSASHTIAWSDTAYLSMSRLDQVPDHFSSPPNEAWVDLDKLHFPLKLRSWQTGDSFQPLGMGGQHQKLQDYFVNQKIDRFTRDQIPLLMNGNGELIWIVGQRLDERYKISQQTLRVARFVFTEKESNAKLL